MLEKFYIFFLIKKLCTKFEDNMKEKKQSINSATLRFQLDCVGCWSICELVCPFLEQAAALFSPQPSVDGIKPVVPFQ